jgi:hypothetical protein
MPTFLYAREIPTGGSDNERRLHRIAFPEYGEPGWYRLVGSFNAFRTGKQKGVPSDLTKRGFGTCGWDHAKGLLYNLKRQDEHEFDLKTMLDSASHVNKEVGDKLRKIYADVEVIDHASLYDFYDFIGFDRKTRRYVHGS